MEPLWPHPQCDQIVLFLEDLGDNFTCKNSPNIFKLLGHSRSGYFLGNFWVNLGYFLFLHLVTLLIHYQSRGQKVSHCWFHT